MKLFISPVALLRVPAFSHTDNLDNGFEKLKAMIKAASPEFYELIKEIKINELQQLNPKVQITIQKFFNRSRFRATPFGEFGAFSILPVSSNNIEPDNNTIILDDPINHQFINWKETNTKNKRISFKNKNTYLQTNASIYVAADRIKYLFFKDETYELSSINYEEFYALVFVFCKHKRKITEVVDYIKNTGSISLEDSKLIIKTLIKLQLLITSDQVNITGPDYFKRISKVSSYNYEPYIISERKVLKGELYSKNYQIVSEVAQFMNRHLPKQSNHELNYFFNKFYERYGDREICLTTALDIQTGIGYGQEEHATDEELPLINELLAKKGKPQQTNFAQSSCDLYTYILNGIIAEKEIRLEKFDGITDNSQLLPNTLSANISQWNNNIKINQLGGCTATALLARFSMASSEIEEFAKTLTIVEQNANKDVVFFDVAYQGEKNVDNINRRKNIYDVELPIAVWSLSTTQLNLEDLMISVSGNEIILRSARLNKRVVPRLASAYNYKRSNLSHFRFLADLQHQGIRSNLLIDIKTIFPGLVSYPRIVYKNAILSPAMWAVPHYLIKYKKSETQDFLYQLKTWLQSLGILFFKFGPHDQTLVFSINNDIDLLLFSKMLSGAKSPYIQEAIIPNNCKVTDKRNSPYMFETILSLQHSEKIYNSISTKISTSNTGLLPNFEWLYFKIFCSFSESNRLLHILAIYLKQNAKVLSKWFFIRYNIPSNHIRLRVKPLQMDQFSFLIQGISSILQPYINQGVISEYQQVPYYPEYVRYGIEAMPLVEDFFYTNSVWVTNLLNNKMGYDELYAITIYFVEQAMLTYTKDTLLHFSFYKTMSDAFAKEFNFTNKSFKMINEVYRKSNYHNYNYMPKNQYRMINKNLKHFYYAIQNADENNRLNVITSLFHMHINRLFSNNQRLHEAIIYNYLYLRAVRYQAVNKSY